MSRLIPLKNINIAILAMRIIVNKLPTAMLHIYGNGPLLEDHKDLVMKLNLQDNVLFYGNIEHEKLTNIIKIWMSLSIHPFATAVPMR